MDLTKRFDSECMNFSTEWYNVADYELKILLLVSVLEDNSLAFNGTLKTMCEWLGIQPTAANNKNIKQAIENLSGSGYIDYTRKGQRFIISITAKGMADDQIIRIRRCWVETLKNYKEQVKDISIGWLNLLKVFVYIYGNDKQHIYTQKEIAAILGISVKTVATALNVLKECKFEGIEISVEVLRERFKDEESKEIIIFNTGTAAEIGIKFED